MTRATPLKAFGTGGGFVGVMTGHGSRGELVAVLTSDGLVEVVARGGSPVERLELGPVGSVQVE